MSSFLRTILKKSFWGRLAISELHALESWFWPRVMSDETAVRRYYRSFTGKDPDLENPVTFSEKLQWYKLKYRNPLMPKCADKVDVREYVADCGHGDLLNEQYGIYDRASQIDLSALPERFVLKSAHGSAQIIIVKDKARVCWWQARLMMRSWLHQHIAWSGREWVYEHLKRRIIAEKYLEDESGELQDFKFFCFHGEPRFMQLERDRFGAGHIRNFYDMQWNLLPFGKGMPPDADAVIPQPDHFEEMQRIASDLAKPFPFVRVDLYQAKGKIYFGELTFFPAGGMPNFCPPEYDRIVGGYWDLKKTPNP